MELIEYIASPGTGKTTAASLAWHKLKVDRHNVEFIREVPQDFLLAGLGSFGNGNQALYLGTYLRKILDLRDMGYNTVICDSSMLTHLLYPDNVFSGYLLEEMVRSVYRHLHTVGIKVTINVLPRDETREFLPLGRHVTQDESDTIQRHVLMLVKNFKLSKDFQGVTIIETHEE